MGVIGFTTFIQDSNAGELLHLSDLSKDKKLIIGIDGNALFYNLAENVLTSAGSYVNLRNEIFDFFENLTRFNIEPVVFLDGLTPSEKYHELESRYQQKLSGLKKVSENLLNEAPFPFVSIPTVKLISVQFRNILKELNIQTHSAFLEGDYEITQWAIDNKGKVFGMISMDSDFYFFTMGEFYFIPLKSIKFSDSSMTATGFKSSKTAQYLQIPEKHLPLLATLIGNDYTKYLRSRFQGPNRSRIPDIINNLKKLKNNAVQSILKEFFVKLSSTDVKNCLNSYNYYSVREEPKSENSGYYSDNGLYFRYSLSKDFERVKAKPYYSRIFSLDCMVNYNYLSPLISHMNQISSFCYEPVIPYQNSLIFHTSSIRQQIFGLLDYPQSAARPMKYADMIPDQNTFKKILMSPLHCGFGIEECHAGSIPLEKRIYQFASWFKVLDDPKLAEYSKRYSGSQSPKLCTLQCFDDMLMIVFTRFLVGLKLCIVIDEWMIDCMLLNYVMLASGSLLPGWPEFKHNEIEYMPVQLTDYYASLFFLSYTALEVMNIPSEESCKLKPPHKILDTTNLHLLWRLAVQNHVSLSPKQIGAERLTHLFPSPTVQTLLTPEMIDQFAYLKNEIHQNLKTSINPTNITTITNTNQIINQLSSLKLNK